ncbi:MAG: hypothetical protein R3D69_10770 [Xanthobacteraceae bacterium]
METTMMLDEKLARIRACRSNIRRYQRLLQTQLTHLERSFIKRRMAEEERTVSELSASTFPIILNAPKSATGTERAA